MPVSNKKLPFLGSAPAVVTPFTCDGRIDWEAFERILEFVIAEGSDAAVVLGTTGEASSLTEEERLAVISSAKDIINRRIPLIVGTGTNSTASTVQNCRDARRLGADAVLTVTPYYTKASPAGLCEHFTRAAEAAEIPLILYTVPSRTGVNIPMSVYEKLAKNENICAVKEASGNLAAVTDLCGKFGDDLAVYSGNDELTLPVIAAGGKGVISVAANIVPRLMHDLCRHALNDGYDKARRIQHSLNPLIHALFSEVNPIPVKCACDLLGLCGETMRLPLTPLDEEKRQILEAELDKLALFD